MDHHLVNIHSVLEALGGNRIWNIEIKPTDGAMIFAYLGEKCETSNRYNSIYKTAQLWHTDIVFTHLQEMIL